jgi:hypothetical protein
MELRILFLLNPCKPLALFLLDYFVGIVAVCTLNVLHEIRV